MDEKRSKPFAGAVSSRVSSRGTIAWGLVLAATLGVAAVAAVVGVVLTVFGLGGLVVAAAAVLVLVGVTIWRRGMLPLAVITLALVLPATWAASSEQRIDRSHGPLVISPRSPAEITDGTYRRGVGPVMVDLRGFSSPAGSTTRIAARADAGRLVVALPSDRCFKLDVRFHNDAIGAPSAFALRTMRALTGEDEATNVTFSGMGLTEQASGSDSARSGRAALAAFKAGEATSPYGFLGFNRWASEAGRYERDAAGQPEAPTLQLNLRSSQQIVVRDYPADVDPLAPVAFSDATGQPVGGIAWPEGQPMPAPPTAQGPSGRSIVRTAQNRARWIAWEDQMIDWAKAQAQRSAGPCPATDDVRARGFSFRTQPKTVTADGHTDRLAGSAPNQRSQVSQRPVAAADTMLLVHVDGFGHTRLGRDQPHAGSETAPMVTP